MPFQKGRSGNPAGRPPKERALTKLVERALSKTEDYGDKRTARKRIMADLLAQAASTGKIVFPDRSEMQLKPDEWIGFVMRLLAHIDGPPKAEVDMDLSVQGLEGFGEILRKIYGEDDDDSED